MAKTISIVIPVYNEEKSIVEIINRVLKANTLGYKKEVIVVDDGSTDSTRELLKKIKNSKVKKLFHKKNKGKGAALRYGFSKTRGQIILVQDADLEYHPKDYPRIIKPFLKKNVKVVYGSRELSGKNRHSSIFFHAGGRLVTLTANILFGAALTDEATGYKAFDAKLLKSLPLKCKRFEFCPEVTALLLKKNIAIHEVPIGYSARHHGQGKKIKAHDGLEAIWTLFRIKFSN